MNTNIGITPKNLQAVAAELSKLLAGNINRFASEYGDVGTSDFVTGLMEEHEKMAWMLRAHLK